MTNTTHTPSINMTGHFPVVTFGSTVIAWGCPMADAIEISRLFAFGMRLTTEDGAALDVAYIIRTIGASVPRLAPWLELKAAA